MGRRWRNDLERRRLEVDGCGKMELCFLVQFLRSETWRRRKRDELSSEIAQTGTRSTLSRTLCVVNGLTTAAWKTVLRPLLVDLSLHMQIKVTYITSTWERYIAIV